MIRIIFSDIDGTLVGNGAHEIPEETIEEISRIIQTGIIFCPASGRQYENLRKLFPSIADDLYYLSENGGLVYSSGNPGKILFKTAMPRDEVMRLLRDFDGEECSESVVCCPGIFYLCPKKQERVDRVKSFMGDRIGIVSDYGEVTGDVIKVSVFCNNPADTLVLSEKYSEKWSSVFKVSIAGPCWLDFTVGDKGSGATGLCSYLGIKPEEVMAFGDNYNDLPMLEVAGYPYIMDNATEELRARFPLHCSSVLDVLRTL